MTKDLLLSKLERQKKYLAELPLISTLRSLIDQGHIIDQRGSYL
jgi:hypothetical protein